MVLNFLSFYNKVDIVNIPESFNLSVEEFVKSPLDSSKMQESVIENLNSFEDIGMYHNYTSKVMPNYTSSECDFLENVFEDKSKKVLDVMCGYGRIANELVSRNYQNVYGVDCSEYSFLNVDKDFNFTLNDFFKYRSLLRFDYLYSLYNCYENVEQLKKVIDKMTSLSSEDAIMVLDVFCKEWRDSIDSNFYAFYLNPIK